MANEETQQEERQHNGHDARRTVVRAAALAAASGATALAAKKALSHDSSSESGDEQKKRRSERSRADGSMVTSMASSAWNSARDSLVPMLEDAAGQAGEYLAKNGPDIVRESIVPRFIRGFERASKSSSDE